MKERMKNQKGITLIALIITIVVLMILAAVAINSITNDGVIGKAESVKNTYTQEQLREQIMLQDYEDMLTAANGGYKDKNFKLGDLVTVGGENFYVIEDKTSLGKVVLLAEKCIEPDKTKSDYLKQSSTASTIAFSETNYWMDAWLSSGVTDLTETGVPDESHYAARVAYDYGIKLGGKGRLMTGPEAINLENKNDEAINIMLYGATDEKLNYWLSTAETPGVVWHVYGDGNNVDSSAGIYNADNYYISVRPVVEISKSKVTKVQ